jgi:hypothetical protein
LFEDPFGEVLYTAYNVYTNKVIILATSIVEIAQFVRFGVNALEKLGVSRGRLYWLSNFNARSDDIGSIH